MNVDIIVDAANEFEKLVNYNQSNEADESIVDETEELESTD